MADEISRKLILVVLLITVVLSVYGTVIILSSSTSTTTTIAANVPAATGRVAINVMHNAAQLPSPKAGELN